MQSQGERGRDKENQGETIAGELGEGERRERRGRVLDELISQEGH